MTVQIGTSVAYGNQSLERSVREIESCIVDHNRIIELLAQIVMSRPELEVSREIKEELAALVCGSGAVVAKIRRLSDNQ